jgi:hypothetical protein
MARLSLPVGLTAACLLLICNLLVGFDSACAEQVKPLAGAQAPVPLRRLDRRESHQRPDAAHDSRREDAELDMYAGVPALMSQHRDSTHATADAVFLPDKAQQLWGTLGVGSIHDLNPTPFRSGSSPTIISGSLFCFSKRACTVSTPALFFRLQSASPPPRTGDRATTGAAIAAEARRDGRCQVQPETIKTGSRSSSGKTPKYMKRWGLMLRQPLDVLAWLG